MNRRSTIAAILVVLACTGTVAQAQTARDYISIVGSSTV
jgi:hypothetical protein